MKLSIRWVIIVGSILLVWCTHFVIAPVSYFMTKSSLTQHMHEILMDVSELTLSESFHYLNKAQIAAKIDMQLHGSNVVSSQIEETSSLERYFFDQLLVNPHLHGIYVGGLNGNFFMVSRNNDIISNGFQTKIIRNEKESKTVKHIWRDRDYMLFQYVEDPTDNYDPRTQLWFAEGLAFDHLIWTDPYILPATNKPGITLTGQVNDSNEGLVGVVGVDIELSELSRFIKNLRVGKSGSAFIISRKGDFIALHDMENKITIAETDNSLMLPTIYNLDDKLTMKSFNSVKWKYDSFDTIHLEKSIMSSFKHDGKKFLAMFTPFPNPELPWIIGVYLPENDYLGKFKANQVFIITTTFIISIIVSIIGYILAKKITIPVTQLANAAAEIEHEKIDQPFQLNSVFTELQNTADSFVRMKESISNYKKKLQESEKIYRAISNTANDAIIMIDSSNEITFFNPAAEKMFGYLSQEIFGTKLTELLDPEQHEPFQEEQFSGFIDRGPAIPQDKTIQIIALKKNGQRIPVELSLSTLKIEDKLHAVAIIRNITDRVKAAQIRKRLVNDLHDGVGGNITNIKLMAEIARAHDIHEQTAKILDAIIDISRDSINEIRNYMDILDNKQLSWKNFAAEIHNHFAMILEAHDKDFSMSLDILPDAPPPTNIVYMNLYKIIQEAVNNVVKHSTGNNVQVALHIRDEETILSIKDNGSINSTQLKPGRGLLSMHSRAKELNGTIQISWDHGLSIVLNFPSNSTSINENNLPQDYEI